MNRTMSGHDARIADRRAVIGLGALIVGLPALAGAFVHHLARLEVVAVTGVVLAALLLISAIRIYRGVPAGPRVLPANAAAGFTSLAVAVLASVGWMIDTIAHSTQQAKVDGALIVLAAVIAAYEVCFAPESKAAARPAPHPYV